VSITLIPQFVLMALMFSNRRRAVKLVCDKTGATPLEASAIVSTPTWRLTAWRRAPANALLLGHAAAKSATAIDPTQSATQLGDPADGQATRLN
jgi:hypothetical protein